MINTQRGGGGGGGCRMGHIDKDNVRARVRKVEEDKEKMRDMGFICSTILRQ